MMRQERCLGHQYIMTILQEYYYDLDNLQILRILGMDDDYHVEQQLIIQNKYIAAKDNHTHNSIPIPGFGSKYCLECGEII